MASKTGHVPGCRLVLLTLIAAVIVQRYRLLATKLPGTKLQCYKAILSLIYTSNCALTWLGLLTPSMCSLPTDDALEFYNDEAIFQANAEH